MKNKGETLVETLMGMLIISIASVLLVNGITASTRLNKRTKEAEISSQFTYTKANPSDVGETDVLYILDKSKNTISEINVKTFVDPNGYIWFEK